MTTETICVNIRQDPHHEGISDEGLQGTVAGREILILVCHDGPLMKDENPYRGDLEKQISTN